MATERQRELAWDSFHRTKRERGIGVWYPGKFGNGVYTVKAAGWLGELLGFGAVPPRSARRAAAAALPEHASMSVAVPGDRWTAQAIEGWCINSNGHVESVAVRFDDIDGTSVWFQTSDGPSKLRILSDTAIQMAPRRSHAPRRRREVEEVDGFRPGHP